MGRVNSQGENEPKERKTASDWAYGGQQLKTEESFIQGALAERPLPERLSLPSVVGGARGPVNKTSPVGFSMPYV
jgi:hypothetical protein